MRSLTTQAPRFAIVACLILLGMIAAMLPAAARDDAVLSDLCPRPDGNTPYVDQAQIADVHLRAVECLTDLNVARGRSTEVGRSYLPAASVRRDQMASLLVRSLRAAGYEPPDPGGAPFEDVAGRNVHARAIASLAAIDVTQGVTQQRYAPHRAVSRAEMATFLLRLYAWAQGVDVRTVTVDEPAFDDTEGLVHQPFIAGAAEVGLVEGVSDTTFDPAAEVSRAQTATFVARLFDAIFVLDEQCENTGWDYTISYPGSWEAEPNGFDGCSLFDPAEFAPADPAAGLRLDLGVRIIVLDVVPGRTFEDVTAQPGDDFVEFLSSEDATVDGRQAKINRYVLSDDAPTGAGLVAHEWVVDLGDFAMVASTFDTEALTGVSEPWFDVEAATLDAMMRTIAIDFPER